MLRRRIRVLTNVHHYSPHKVTALNILRVNLFIPPSFPQPPVTTGLLTVSMVLSFPESQGWNPVCMLVTQSNSLRPQGL